VTTNAERTHLIVFAEGRFVTSCAPPWQNEDGGLDMRRSTDSGATWLPARTVYSGNIDFYTVVWDSTSNTVYLMLEAPSSVLVFTSRDEVSFLGWNVIFVTHSDCYTGNNMVRSDAFECVPSPAS
jgi:hypothetical protein